MAQARQGQDKPSHDNHHNSAPAKSGTKSLSEATPLKQQLLLSKPPVRSAGGEALPDPLRESIAQLSGVDLSHASVHYNSDKPKLLGASAYAEGDKIYLGTGQEHLLPHEAWHLVQQAQGRVSAESAREGHPINTNETLEQEAERMGEQAQQQAPGGGKSITRNLVRGGSVAQLAQAEIVRVEIFKNANEVKITLANGKTYTYPLILSDLKEPLPLKHSDPVYKSGQIITAKHKGGVSRDRNKHSNPDTTAGKFTYNWTFEGVKGQPGLEQLPASNYQLVFYLKGGKGGSGNGEGEGAGDKKGDGEQGRKDKAKDKSKGKGDSTTGGGDAKKNEEKVNALIKKMGGQGKDTDGTALTEDEKKRAGEALADLSEAEQEHFLKTMEVLEAQCQADSACKGQGLADLLEFYKNLDEASKEALSINQMLKSDPTSESDELPKEVLLNIKTDAKATAESMAKAQDINANLALIQSKITDPALKKDFEAIDLSKLSELNTLIMIQGLLAGGSERLPELQPVAIELTTNIGKLRDFILEEIAWLAAEIGATMLFSAITAPLSGGASLVAGAAAAGHLAIRLNKLRKLIKKIQNLMAVVDKIQGMITTFQAVKDNLEKADHLLKTFEDKRAEVQKLQELLRKGEATAAQISQMENLEDELLALMLGTKDKPGMIDQLEPMMDRFFLPEDLTDEELKGLFYDIPDGITAVQEMLAYKKAVEGGSADQTVTLSLKGFRAGYLLAPFVGFLTGTINDKLNEIMAEKSVAERLSGFGGRSGKKGGFKGSSSKPQKRLKKVKTHKEKRADAAAQKSKSPTKKPDKNSDKKDAKSKGKDQEKDKTKKKDDDKSTSPTDKSKLKWLQMKAELESVLSQAKDQGGMTQTEIKKKASVIVSKAEYKLFKAKVSISNYTKDQALNQLKVEDKGSTTLPASKPGGKPTKRKPNKDLPLTYLRPETERHKSLNAAIRSAFKSWPEDKSDTKDAIAAKLTELKRKHGYPVQLKYPAGKAKEDGKVEVEAEKVKGDIVAWKIMTSLRKGQLAEIIRIDRPGNYWGSKNNPIQLTWKKPAITDNSSKAYKPIYVGPYVAGEARVKQSELEAYYSKTLAQRDPLADAIIASVKNTQTKDKVKEWKKNPVIEKYEATGPSAKNKLPSPSRTTVGVTPEWQVKNGHDLFPFKPPLARGNEAGSTITNKFRLFGFYAAEESMDGDHVWEIQLGGPDKVENMWPLDAKVNQQGGTDLESTKLIDDKGKTVKMRDLKKDARENIKDGKDMWIKVKVP